jgi:hypothetical protein
MSTFPAKKKIRLQSENFFFSLGQLLLFGQTKDKKMENQNGNVNQIPFVATLTPEGQVHSS